MSSSGRTAVRAQFGAPWCRELFILTAIGVFVAGTPTAIQLARGHWVIGFFLLGLLSLFACLTVRGYEVTRDQLLIRRLLWTTRWPLRQNTAASIRPGVMAHSWRIWGNGGLFSFSGRFSNSQLGRYQAFVTDFQRTVVVDTPRGLLVVSPDEPVAFAEAVAAMTAADP